ncbi:MAG: hypothetical protein NZ893_02655 [Candidatus Aenigmarchaeota archaeon]|nr:hypothetical protein [Candidatus Aenigmarchaeota archaeon]
MSKIKKFLKETKAFFTKPLSEKEKKLLKNIENVNLFGDMDIFKDKNPKSVKDEVKMVQRLEKKCKHLFYVEDFETQTLRCKNCGLKIKAYDLGKSLGKEVMKKRVVDLDDIFNL